MFKAKLFTNPESFVPFIVLSYFSNYLKLDTIIRKGIYEYKLPFLNLSAYSSGKVTFFKEEFVAKLPNIYIYVYTVSLYMMYPLKLPEFSKT